jgi:putative ABC transport system permease protein
VGGFALLAPLLQRPIAWLGTRPFTGVAAGPLRYSLIAVANTLIIAAAGRRREFALLSMAGATRPQILRIVAAESLLAVAVGTLIAAASGLGVNAVQRLSLRQLITHPPVVVPWADAWQAVSLCAAVAVAAAVLSAWSIMQSSTIAAVASRE